MTTLVVATSEGVDLRLDVAGAGSRAAAALLDLAILLILYLLVVLAVLIPMSFDPTGISGFVVGLFVGGGLLVGLLYHAFFQVVLAGQTPGKRVLSIRVLAADGHPASVLQIVLRSLLLPIDLLLMLPVPIGLILIAATTRHHRLGDLVAGTIVVRSPRGLPRPEPFPGETWSGLNERTLPLSAGAAAHLDAHDRDILRELLTRPSLTDRARRSLFIRAAKRYCERLALGPFDDARVVLKELYLFARESGV